MPDVDARLIIIFLEPCQVRNLTRADKRNHEASRNCLNNRSLHHSKHHLNVLKLRNFILDWLYFQTDYTFAKMRNMLSFTTTRLSQNCTLSRECFVSNVLILFWNAIIRVKCTDSDTRCHAGWLLSGHLQHWCCSETVGIFLISEDFIDTEKVQFVNNLPIIISPCYAKLLFNHQDIF